MGMPAFDWRRFAGKRRFVLILSVFLFLHTTVGFCPHQRGLGSRALSVPRAEAMGGGEAGTHCTRFRVVSTTSPLRLAR